MLICAKNLDIIKMETVHLHVFGRKKRRHRIKAQCQLKDADSKKNWDRVFFIGTGLYIYEHHINGDQDSYASRAGSLWTSCSYKLKKLLNARAKTVHNSIPLNSIHKYINLISYKQNIHSLQPIVHEPVMFDSGNESYLPVSGTITLGVTQRSIESCPGHRKTKPNSVKGSNQIPYCRQDCLFVSFQPDLQIWLIMSCYNSSSLWQRSWS